MSTVEHWELCSMLDYNPDTGIFKNAITRNSRAPAGKIAGYIDRTGYIQIRIAGRNYLAHRLAWFYVHGVWPIGIIDHRNGIKSDNRISNLSDTSSYHNQQNQRHAHCDSKSGLLGVYWHKSDNAWRAIITTNGKRKYLGNYKTAEEAYSAYLKEKLKHHYAPRFGV